MIRVFSGPSKEYNVIVCNEITLGYTMESYICIRFHELHNGVLCIEDSMGYIMESYINRTPWHGVLDLYK